MIFFWSLFYDDLFIHTKLAQKRILILCLKCLHNVSKHSNWNQYTCKIRKNFVHICAVSCLFYYKKWSLWFNAFFIWPLRHYSHFDTGTSASVKQFLPLFSFALAGPPFQFEVQTTDMKSLNLISCTGIHIRMSSITYAYKNHKCYFSFSIQKISFTLEYKFVSMTL